MVDIDNRSVWLFVDLMIVIYFSLTYLSNENMS